MPLPLLPILALFGLGVAASRSSKTRRRPRPVLEIEKTGPHENLWRFHTVDAFAEFITHEDELEAQGFAVGPVSVMYSNAGQPELAAAHGALLALAGENPQGIFFEVSKGIMIDGLLQVGVQAEDASIPGSIVIVPGPWFDQAIEVEAGAPADAVIALVNDVYETYLAIVEGSIDPWPEDPWEGEDTQPPPPQVLECLMACNEHFIPGTGEHGDCLLGCVPAVSTE